MSADVVYAAHASGAVKAERRNALARWAEREFGSPTMKTILLLLISAAVAWGGTCKGDKDCTACTNCTQCAWCTSGKAPCGVRIKTKQDLVDALADTLVATVVDAISSRKVPSGTVGNRIKRELAHGAAAIIVNTIFSSEAEDVKAKRAKRDLVDLLADCVVDAMTSGKASEDGKANQTTRDRVDALVDTLLNSIWVAIPGDKVEALVKATVDGVKSRKK